MILFKNKKIISFLVASILVLSFSVCAYADDDSGDTSYSPEDRYATEEEIQELDSAISETSHTLSLLMASGDSVKATDYEQATYNLLSSIFGSSTSSWASIVATRLGYLSTINTSANSIAVKLTGFYNSINPDYDTTGISLYDVAHGILTALTTIDPDDGDLTIIETLVYITTALDDLDTDLTAILNSTYSIDNKLVNINTTIVQFKSDLISAITSLKTDMNTGFSNVNANMALIISRLETINNNYNNIDWIDISISNTLVYDSIVYSTSGLSNVTNGVYSKLYYYFDIPQTNFISKYFMFSCQVMTSNFLYDYDIHYYVLNRYNTNWVEIPSYTFDFFNSTYANTTFVSYLNYRYDYGSINNLSHMMISIEPKTNSLFKYNNSFTCKYVDYNSLDFYTINSYDILNRFKSIYASDDLIEAKDNQQPYEDQAIADFTGSGSASASLSDLGGLKSVSSAFKSGLDSGGSVSNALSIFSNNSGFWGWFSQSNYNDINNLSNSGSNTRSGNNIQEDIIDFYSDNMLNLMYLLQNVGD